MWCSCILHDPLPQENTWCQSSLRDGDGLNTLRSIESIVAGTAGEMRWHVVGKVGTVGVGGTHGGRRHPEEIEGEKEKGWGAQEVVVGRVWCVGEVG